MLLTEKHEMYKMSALYKENVFSHGILRCQNPRQVSLKLTGLHLSGHEGNAAASDWTLPSKGKPRGTKHLAPPHLFLPEGNLYQKSLEFCCNLIGFIIHA